MTEYQANSLREIINTEPISSLDLTKELFSWDRVIENVLIFSFPKHLFYLKEGSTTIVGRN